MIFGIFLASLGTALVSDCRECKRRRQYEDDVFGVGPGARGAVPTPAGGSVGRPGRGASRPGSRRGPGRRGGGGGGGYQPFSQGALARRGPSPVTAVSKPLMSMPTMPALQTGVSPKIPLSRMSPMARAQTARAIGDMVASQYDPGDSTKSLIADFEVRGVFEPDSNTNPLNRGIHDADFAMESGLLGSYDSDATNDYRESGRGQTRSRVSPRSRPQVETATTSGPDLSAIDKMPQGFFDLQDRGDSLFSAGDPKDSVGTPDGLFAEPTPFETRGAILSSRAPQVEYADSYDIEIDSKGGDDPFDLSKITMTAPVTPFHRGDRL